MTALTRLTRPSRWLDLAVIAYALLGALVTYTAGRSVLAFLWLLSSILLATSLPLSRPVRILLPAFVILIVLPIVGVRNTFYLEIVTQVGIFAALAVGLNIVVGFAGLLDLGYVAFFASGAYLWGIFGSPQGQSFFHAAWLPVPAWAFWIFLLLAVGVAALFGILLGLPVLRLRGDYLAIVTLGFGEVIRILANNLDKPTNDATGLNGLTNGPQGIAGIEGAPFTWVTNFLSGVGVAQADMYRYQAVMYFLLVLAVIAVAVVATQRLDHSRIGRAWVAIREDEVAAQAMGVPLVKTKLIAFATGASFAGIMGAIFAARQLTISPENFDFNESIGVLAMVVLGGLGSIRGAILGAAVLTILNIQILPALSQSLNGLRNAGTVVLGYNLANLPSQFEPAKYQRLVFGLVLIVMMIYRPEGLIPARRRSLELKVHEAPLPAAPEMPEGSVS
ncbi:MAG TPA: branched-chain amino acid ABC transporter permease [Deinococcales bacterium]|nr:branched-chain amino acid ABC transporter permease [Deinococcales bacterium]